MKKIYALIVTYNFDEIKIIKLVNFLEDKVEKTIICNNSENIKFSNLKSNKNLRILELIKHLMMVLNSFYYSIKIVGQKII